MNKTTLNMAAKRNIHLDDDGEMLCIGHVDGDCIDAYYTITDNGFFLSGSDFGQDHITDWPHWIENEKTLRAYLAPISEAVTAP